jgi:hypothetical protein
MIEGQEVMEITNLPNFCWRSTNKGSFSTHVWVYFLFVQCLIQFLQYLSFRKRLRTAWQTTSGPNTVSLREKRIEDIWKQH